MRKLRFRSRLTAVLCMGIGIGLSGCSLTRPPAQVEAPVPAQWRAPLPHGGSLASLANWWSQLDDPLLVELIAAAEAASPNVASAAARVAEARFTRVQAGAALLPSLDGTASASRGPVGVSGGEAPVAFVDPHDAPGAVDQEHALADARKQMKHRARGERENALGIERQRGCYGGGCRHVGIVARAGPAP